LIENANAPGTPFDFLEMMAVCHGVIPEKVPGAPDGIAYQSASPDETALVEGVRKLGFFFNSRKPKGVTVNINGIIHAYEILAVNEFNSTRKRMSVLIRNQSGQLKILVKGADTVIFERLVQNDPNLVITNKHLGIYATEGYRTLCLASRDVTEEEYISWKSTFDEASVSLDNRSDKLEKAAELIEKDLKLLGATAIEDKLQDGVPETISVLMKAGIKLWVLTGDKQETAINIGCSSKVITPSMEVLICNEDTLEDTKKNLESSLKRVLASMPKTDPYINMSWWKRFKRNIKQSDRGKFSKSYGDDANAMVLVIDGKTLTHALDKSLSKVFLQLALLCKSVICCRVSPLQKALVVKLVRNNVARTVTLAIGDGANDVTMIQAANVGIGISGLEGLQAARSADFSIGQFRFLQKLLLVHGGWSYSRISKVIVFSFYKNFTLYLIQLWYATNNQFSGSVFIMFDCRLFLKLGPLSLLTMYFGHYWLPLLLVFSTNTLQLIFYINILKYIGRAKGMFSIVIIVNIQIIRYFFNGS
jgi:phospholipid-transporting ATPase